LEGEGVRLDGEIIRKEEKWKTVRGKSHTILLVTARGAEGIFLKGCK